MGFWKIQDMKFHSNRSFLLVLWFCFAFLKTAKTEETNSVVNLNVLPNSEFQTSPFNTNVTFRQDICDLHKTYYNRSVDLADALRGTSIRAVLNCPNDYCFMKDGGLDPENPGIYAEILDELARRAGFDWRDSFAVVDTAVIQEENKTFTDLLTWNTETYDLAVSWWTKTTQRIRKGVDFPEGWYDSSIIMIAKKSANEQPGFNVFSFLTPFSPMLWLMIGITTVVSGLLYYLLDLLDPRADDRNLRKDPVKAVLIASVTILSHFEFTPRTKLAWVFTFSVCALSLVIVASYTANLASFLVVRNTRGIGIQTLEDAVANGYTICVYKDSAIDELLKKDFRLKGKFIRKESPDGSILGVRNGECNIAAVAVGIWESQKLNDNIGCELEWIGREYKNIPAGFATIHDSGEKCTSLISEVIDIHLRDMHDDGTIDEIWGDHLGVQTCSETNANELTETDQLQLSLSNMGGAFLCHFVVVFAVVAAAIFARYSGMNKKRNERLEVRDKMRSLKEMQKKIDLKKSVMLSAKNGGEALFDNELDPAGHTSKTVFFKEEFDSETSFSVLEETITELRDELRKSHQEIRSELQGLKRRRVLKRDDGEVLTC